jgi:hypothetical protein
MQLNPQRISTREKLILAGLYLSKYDSGGLEKLGFEGFLEAFNMIGYALGAKPMTVKNYRDEFDPVFRNPRKGWHKRPIRDYCRKVLEEYEHLEMDDFAGLIKSFAGYNESLWSEVGVEEEGGAESSFAKRLLTGLAAERYFESVQPKLNEFQGYVVENTTQVGCGYDFRLRKEADKDFLAVEVKGLNERTGTLSLTPKEYQVATALTNRFFLFVVKNFRESPFHEIYQNPLLGQLRFVKKEIVAIHISWLTTV